MSSISIYLSASVNNGQYIYSLPVCLCQQRSVYTCLPMSTKVSRYCMPLSTTVSIYLSASVNHGQYIPVCLCQQRSVYTCLPMSTKVSIYLSASVNKGQYIPVSLCHQRSVYTVPVCLCQQRSVYTCLPMSPTVSIYLSAYVINGQYIPVCLSPTVNNTRPSSSAAVNTCLFPCQLRSVRVCTATHRNARAAALANSQRIHLM